MGVLDEGVNAMHKDAPCKGCNMKQPGCHDECEDYKQWKENHLKQQAALREYKLQERESFLRSEQCLAFYKKRRY